MVGQSVRSDALVLGIRSGLSLLRSMAWGEASKTFLCMQRDRPVIPFRTEWRWIYW